MPVYEYRCDDCESVFELLRPPRQATRAQPCPDCDADARRIMSMEFVPFVMRDGLPRKVPDNGKFKHLGKVTDSPYATDKPGHQGGQYSKDLKATQDKKKQTTRNKAKTNAEVTARTISGRHGVSKTRISKSRK